MEPPEHAAVWVCTPRPNLWRPPSVEHADFRERRSPCDARWGRHRAEPTVPEVFLLLASRWTTARPDGEQSHCQAFFVHRFADLGAFSTRARM